MVLPPPATAPKTRKHLSADALHRLLSVEFSKIPDHRRNSMIALPDALLSAFALFSLKDPSLLAFDARRSDENLKALYGIHQVPCDTRMRKIRHEHPHLSLIVVEDVGCDLGGAQVADELIGRDQVRAFPAIRSSKTLQMARRRTVARDEFSTCS